MSKIHNNSVFRSRRKILRRNQTKAETILWSKLRNKQLLGLKFKRQHSIGSYIVDFYCAELALVIEVDGDSHLTEDAKTYDDVREKYFEGLNIKTARFKNDEVLLDVEMVLQKIKDYFV